ncbi:hypothetical protein TWF694_007686 [Orbilia ellipsospora]|uniref:CBM1 domain-containing protein n=1 Tax=Orbilia ellipsospora TaxID=2528407 RepID=A0AAV9XIF4_9PEZI
MLGQFPPIARGWGFGKRDYDGVEYSDYQLEPQALFKRQQDPVCDCLSTSTAIYPLTTLEPYMATAYGNCDQRWTTSNLCPIQYNCGCQVTGTSMCVPTSVVPGTGCTVYNGPKTKPATQLWWLSSPLAYGAVPSGQCGGVPKPTGPTTWPGGKKICPISQACACDRPDYWTCIGVTDASYTGTACRKPTSTLSHSPATTHAANGTCRYAFSVSMPPPSATAHDGEQCGGKCWTGPTNCSPGMTCYTETAPSPGAYAACYSAKPYSKRIMRRNGEAEGINVPARVQAMATPVYF